MPCLELELQEEISVPELRFVPAEPAHLQESLGCIWHRNCWATSHVAFPNTFAMTPTSTLEDVPSFLRDVSTEP